VWNILRLGSSGFGYTVKDSTGQDDEKGKHIIDELLPRINARYGGLDGLIVQWLLSGFLQGAVTGEVALTENLKDIDDFHAIDPQYIECVLDAKGKVIDRFRPARGGAPVVMNPEKFWYVPIDSYIDDPYGRPPAAPVLQEVWFDVALITDLRKVVHNQGWPRIDIKILEEVLTNNAPASVKNNEEKLAKWINDRVTDVGTAYNALHPDDSFIHTDSVEINQATDNTKMFDVSALMRIIERRMIKALKQLPILMASNEGTTETHGTVQWKIFVAGLRSLQDPIAFVLGRMLQLSLDVYGYQGRVECWFEPIETTDRKADAEAEKVEIDNAIRKWAAGFQTWEESSIEVTGSAPPEGVEEPDPAMVVGGSASASATGVNANAGATRVAMSAQAIDPITARLDAEFDLYPDLYPDLD